jgi:hypothetical protein
MPRHLEAGRWWTGRRGSAKTTLKSTDTMKQRLEPLEAMEATMSNVAAGPTGTEDMEATEPMEDRKDIGEAGGIDQNSIKSVVNIFLYACVIVYCKNMLYYVKGIKKLVKGVNEGHKNDPV